MWLERYLNRPILENVGFDEPGDIMADLLHVKADQIIPSEYAMPLMSEGSGERWLLSGGQHTLCIGTTGSGKTRRWLARAILSALQTQSDSMLVLDIKGELRAMTEPVAKKLGYRIHTIDLKDLTKSCKFPPLHWQTRPMRRGTMIWL